MDMTIGVPQGVAEKILRTETAVLAGVRMRRTTMAGRPTKTLRLLIVAAVLVDAATTIQEVVIRVGAAAALHGLAMVMGLRGLNMNSVPCSAASWTRVWLNATWASFSKNIWDVILC